MTDAAPGIGTMPLILCIDVEPAARAPVTQADCDWSGFEELAELLQTLRPSLADATGSPVHYSWFLRMDPQIERIYGSANWLGQHYRSLFTDLERSGDEIGLHIHPYRWEENGTGWISDFGDAGWGTKVVEGAFEAFRSEFGRPCRSVRFGDRWLSAKIVRAAWKLGARFDLTPEPGVKPDDPPELSKGSKPDYTDTSSVPYRPRRRAPHLRGVAWLPGRPWMIPVTTVDRQVSTVVAWDESIHASTAPSQISGWLDRVEADYVTGWAYDDFKPACAVGVVVYDGDEPIASALADEFRPDLLAAGVGAGRHGFTAILSPSLRDGREHRIGVRPAGADVWLSGSPVTGQWQPDKIEQRYQTVDLGHPWMAALAAETLSVPGARKHLAFVTRSNTPGEIIADALDRLRRHPLAPKVRVTTPQGAMRLARKAS